MLASPVPWPLIPGSQNLNTDTWTRQHEIPNSESYIRNPIPQTPWNIEPFSREPWIHTLPTTVLISNLKNLFFRKLQKAPRAFGVFWKAFLSAVYPKRQNWKKRGRLFCFFWPEKFLYVPGTIWQTVRKNFLKINRLTKTSDIIPSLHLSWKKCKKEKWIEEKKA